VTCHGTGVCNGNLSRLWPSSNRPLYPLRAILTARLTTFTHGTIVYYEPLKTGLGWVWTCKVFTLVLPRSEFGTPCPPPSLLSTASTDFPSRPCFLVPCSLPPVPRSNSTKTNPYGLDCLGGSGGGCRTAAARACTGERTRCSFDNIVFNICMTKTMVTISRISCYWQRARRSSTECPPVQRAVDEGEEGVLQPFL
jgi:hypothetical protein